MPLNLVLRIVAQTIAEELVVLVEEHEELVEDLEELVVPSFHLFLQVAA